MYPYQHIQIIASQYHRNSKNISSKVRPIQPEKLLQEIVIIQKLYVSSPTRQLVQCASMLSIEQHLHSLQPTNSLSQVVAKSQNLFLT